MVGPKADNQAIAKERVWVLSVRGFGGAFMRLAGLLALACAALWLCGCESAGFAPESAPDLITPSVDAKTTVRHWDASGQPVEREVPSQAPFN